jgi:hypothetical protein
MARLFNKVQEAWCRLMHPDPMWPVNGFYRCPACLREYPVCWEEHSHNSQAPAVQPVPVSAVAQDLHAAHAGLRIVKAFRRQAA